MKKELLFTFSALIATTSCNIKKTDSEQIAGKKPMNIIYIMSDDHSYQTISAYDKRFIQTPNIDRLANEGVRFTNSFVANSISGPSRACILTGKHSHANGFTDNSSTFDGSQQTYPKLLQKAGYETAIIGKWHLTSAPTGFDYSEIFNRPRHLLQRSIYQKRETGPIKRLCYQRHHRKSNRLDGEYT